MTSYINILKAKVTEAREKASALIAERVVSDEIHSQRVSICKSCEHLFKPTSQCKKCGCFVEAKAYITNSACPVGKWTAVEKTTDK